MNAQELQGQWNRIKGQVKEKWGQLTDDDLRIDSGNIDQLIGRIQEKTGQARETIEKYLGDLTAKGAETTSRVAESAREYAGATANRLREGYDRAQHYVADGYESSEDFVRHRPSQSVAMAFGLGLVVGLVATIALRR